MTAKIEKPLGIVKAATAWCFRNTNIKKPLPAKMDAISSANGLTKPISILDAVIWTAEVKKQSLHQHYRVVLRKQDFLLIMSMMKKEMKGNPWARGDTQSDTYEDTEGKVMLTLIIKMKQELLQRKSTNSLRITSKVRTRRMRNKEEEEDTFPKQLEECKLKSYDDAHKTSQNFRNVH